MLDVAVVGTVMVTFCMSIYKKIGVIVPRSQAASSWADRASVAAKRLR